MPFKWKDYSKVAKTIAKYAKVNSTVEEGFNRAAISRAYYAAYHAALAYAITKGYNFKNYQSALKNRRSYTGGLGSHKVLFQFFLDYPDNSVKALGTSLQRCHNKRINCDYKLQPVNERYKNIAFQEIDGIQPQIMVLP